MARNPENQRAVGALGLALALSLGAGCATSVDGPVAESCDPASPDAEAAPLPQLGAALREDPPLPGTRRPGWPALDGAQPAAADEVAPEAQSRGVHGHHH